MAEERIRRINIPVPNPGLAEWLNGPECRAQVEMITQRIFVAYQQALPVITGNLKRGAYYYVDKGGWGADKDRWFGWVGNNALSYRKTKNQPYPRFIEYGKPTRGIEGQHQLRDAIGEMADGLSVNLPGISSAPEGRGSRLRGAGGRFVANPMNRDAPRRRKRTK